jgi:hypothetical protein
VLTPTSGPGTATHSPAGTSTGTEPAVSYSIPPPEHPHTWAELLTLVGAVRRIAFDRTLPPSEALGRIRDAFQDYDHSSQS